VILRALSNALDSLTLARTVHRLARQVDALTMQAREQEARADAAEQAHEWFLGDHKAGVELVRRAEERAIQAEERASKLRALLFDADNHAADETDRANAAEQAHAATLAALEQARPHPLLRPEAMRRAGWTSPEEERALRDLRLAEGELTVARTQVASLRRDLALALARAERAEQGTAETEPAPETKPSEGERTAAE
jgi:hypothetical protein